MENRTHSIHSQTQTNSLATISFVLVVCMREKIILQFNTHCNYSHCIRRLSRECGVEKESDIKADTGADRPKEKDRRRV